MVSLKMSSERVIGGETVNTENLSGFIWRTANLHLPPGHGIR